MARSTEPSNIWRSWETNGSAFPARQAAKSRVHVRASICLRSTPYRHPGNVSGRQPAEGGQLEHGNFPQVAEACHKGGNPFGIGLGETSDSVDSAGAFLLAFGGALVDAKGNVTVKTDAVRQWLDSTRNCRPSCRQTFRHGMTPKQQWLVSGNGAMIMNPPSAWAVAKRDAPKIAEHAGLTASRRDRKAASHRTFRSSTRSGISHPTNRRPRAC